MSDKNNQLNEYRCEVPVMLCTFTRLDTTKMVFEQIRKVKPKKLYLVSDGPRESHPEDKEKIEAVHEYIEGNIDWDCEVLKNYSDVNLGCGKRMPTGISWVFEHEERAVFLEDDCVPEISFFRYCEEMLEKYEDNEQILLISGNNPIAFKNWFGKFDYGFSKLPGTWGWASWRTKWLNYDYDMKSWPEKKSSFDWKRIYPTRARWTYLAEFDTVYKHEYDAWDYQVTYMLAVNDGLVVAPGKNQVRNAGFSAEGSTHTVTIPEWMDQKSVPFEFPLVAPSEVKWNRDYDNYFMKNEFKHGYVVKIKHILGLNVNKSFFER